MRMFIKDADFVKGSTVNKLFNLYTKLKLQ